MILDLFKLDGKVAVVTGANTGLGQGMAVALAQAGAKVLGVARRSCEDTKNKIEADGGAFAEVIADLSDMASIDVVMKAAIDTYGTGWLADLCSKECKGRANYSGHQYF